MMSLTLIRGLPGSGKSFWAQKLALTGMLHLESDQYFQHDGEYKFVVSDLGVAHAWCQRTTDLWLGVGDDVIVSNTFTTLKELRPYFDLALKHGIIPSVITCQGEFGSIHNVPEETLAKMKARFTHDISILYKELYAAHDSNR